MPKILTKEIIFAKYKVKKLEEIKNLNLWGNDIENIEIIKDLHNLEVIGLSVNKINTLQYFSYCPELTELYLRKNGIEDIKEIIYLKNCPKLKILWLEENPISNHPNYRQYIIKALPQLMKLDNVSISQTERELIKNSESEDSLNNEIEKKDNISKSTPYSHRRSNTFYSSRGNKIKNLFSRQSSKFEFTFSDQADSSNQNDTSSHTHNNESSNLHDMDYLKQFRNLNELTSYFSSPDNLDKMSHNTMSNDELLSKNRNTIQHFENYNFNNKVFEIRENIQLCLNPRSDTTNKPKSNWNLIKAIFNLLEELDNSQLIYLSDVIGKRLKKGNTDNN